VNDLPNCPLASDIVLYADDTVLYYSSKDLSDLQRHLNVDLETVSESCSPEIFQLLIYQNATLSSLGVHTN